MMRTPAAATARTPGQKFPAANDHVAEARASVPAEYAMVRFMDLLVGGRIPEPVK